MSNDAQITFEVQRNTRFGWVTAEYAKPGKNSEKLIFKTIQEARKSYKAMEKRNLAYGWGMEFRIVRKIVTTDVIA